MSSARPSRRGAAPRRGRAGGRGGGCGRRPRTPLRRGQAGARRRCRSSSRPAAAPTGWSRSEGVAAGDQVVTAGQNRLSNGAPVIVDNSVNPAAPGAGGRAMNFSEIFIRRPVLSTVLGAFILLLGFQGIFNLPVRAVPGGRGDGGHDHHHLSRRAARPDPGLHHRADRRGGRDDREHRLRHLAEPALGQRRQRATCSSAPTPTWR